MNAANRAFYSMVTLALFVAIGLAAATARLLLPFAGEVGPATRAVTRWCQVLLSGSPGVDELLPLGLLGLFPVILCLGVASLGYQWWATRRLVRARVAVRVHRLPRRITRLSHRLGLGDRVDVVRAAQPYSFCHGLLRPRVCVSSGLVHLLTEPELEAVLLHERYHVHSHDPAKILLARALGRAFFFLPLVAELGRHYAIAKELAADHAVVREQGRRGRLASALHKLITVPPVGDIGAALGNLVTAIDARIDHLLDPNGPERPRFSTSALVTSALALVAVVMILLSAGLVDARSHVHALLESPANVCLLA